MFVRAIPDFNRHTEFDLHAIFIDLQFHYDDNYRISIGKDI